MALHAVLFIGTAWSKSFFFFFLEPLQIYWLLLLLSELREA